MRAQRLVAGLHPAVVLQVRASVERGPQFQVQVDVASEDDGTYHVLAGRYDDAPATVGRAQVDALLHSVGTHHRRVTLGPEVGDDVVFSRYRHTVAEKQQTK